MTMCAVAATDAITSRIDYHYVNDVNHLEAVLRLGGCADRSAACARVLLDEAGSLGAALAFSEARLTRLGVAGGVARNLAVLRSAQVAALRRDLQERPWIQGLDALLDYLHATMAHLSYEAFRVVFLDNRRRLIRDEVVHRGTLNSCSAHPREIFFRAIELAARYLVLVHNHPTGALEPSREDLAITNRLVAAGDAMDVGIDDHVIICRSGYFSFREAGLLRRFPSGLEPLPPK